MAVFVEASITACAPAYRLDALRIDRIRHRYFGRVTGSEAILITGAAFTPEKHAQVRHTAGDLTDAPNTLRMTPGCR